MTPLAYDGVMAVLGSRLADGDVVVREVGRGASAHVYLVSDGERVRAVKLLRAGEEARARHELRVAERLEHPNVNKVHAQIELDGRPALLMAFAPGRRLLARNRHPGLRERYLDAFEELLAALAHLHERGVVHRDVKPENVMVDVRGRVRLIDFDLAIVEGVRTQPGLVGTLAYLSPEQARGQRAVPASDVYAAGVMLYGALTGEVPFTGTVAEVVTQHADIEVEPPSRFDPGLAPIDALLLSMLAKDPAARPSDGAAALEAVRGVREELRHRAGRERGVGW